MARRAYILTFDRDDEMNYKEFHRNLTELPGVITWWHYIKSSYILISNQTSATKLNEEIKTLIPSGKSILLIEVNLKNRNGLLVKDAWEWLKREASRII
jgi:hypothetical protein